LDNAKTWTGLTLEKAIQVQGAPDRTNWRRLVHDAANSRIKDKRPGDAVAKRGSLVSVCNPCVTLVDCGKRLNL